MIICLLTPQVHTRTEFLGTDGKSAWLLTAGTPNDI